MAQRLMRRLNNLSKDTELELNDNLHTEAIQQFCELVKQNPNLPVLCMVDSDVVADDSYCRYGATIGHSRIDRYVCTDERIYFYDEADFADVLERIYDDEFLSGKSQSELIALYNKLNWVEVIVLNIDEPGLLQRLEDYNNDC